MKREPARLANERFDLLVVGAGIYGATIAAAAAERGLKVALIDKGDFGHATSANSQKIIHGGLRYLQHLDLKRMRESITARRLLMTAAPHLVRPLQCIVPTQGHALRSKLVMALALGLNDLVSWDRNKALDSAHRLPRGRTVSAAECLRMIPGLSSGEVTGGAVWFDAIAWNTERLTLAFVASAAANGACVANYVEAVGYLDTNKAVRGVTGKDVLSGDTFDIRASAVVNAMGPWSGGLSAANGGRVTGLPRSWCRAMNIVINRPLFGDYAVGLTAGKYVDRDAVLNKGTRDFFFVPWRGSTIIGTFYDRSTNSGATARFDADDIHRMLKEINAVHPEAGLKPSDVGFVHAGLLPELPGSSDLPHVQLMKHPVIVDTGTASRAPGLLSIVGVKYTTAARMAQDIVRRICDKSGRTSMSTGPESRQPAPRGTACSTKLDEAVAAGTISPDTGDRLRGCYGPAQDDVCRYLETSESRQRLGPGCPVMVGEVIYAVRQEMAHKLSDVVFRRTGLGSDRYPGRTALLRCAEAMAAEHGWTMQGMTVEIDLVEQRYAPLFDAGCIERPGRLAAAAAGETAGIANRGRE